MSMSKNVLAIILAQGCAELNGRLVLSGESVYP